MISLKLRIHIKVFLNFTSLGDEENKGMCIIEVFLFFNFNQHKLVISSTWSVWTEASTKHTHAPVQLTLGCVWFVRAAHEIWQLLRETLQFYTEKQTNTFKWSVLWDRSCLILILTHLLAGLMMENLCLSLAQRSSWSASIVPSLKENMIVLPLIKPIKLLYHIW